MKRISALGVAILVGLIMAHQGLAQEPEKGWLAGIRGGLNLADIDFPGVDFDARTGFAAGALAGYRFHPQWAVHAIVSYTQKGAKDEGTSTQGAFTRKIKIPYVELQVPAVLMPPLANENLAPRAYIGPYIAYELGCDVTLEDPTGVETSTCEEGAETGIAPQTASIDYGLTIGLGLDLMRGNSGFSIDFVYDLGLGNINDTPAAPEIRNRVIQILIGYVQRL
jgi:hypothetical protein